MRQKDKYFIFGLLSGFSIPFIENLIRFQELDVASKLAEIILLGGEVWHYVFLYLVLINSVILYVRRFREKINPNSRIIFILSGTAVGFSLISIISANVQFFK